MSQRVIAKERQKREKEKGKRKKGKKKKKTDSNDVIWLPVHPLRDLGNIGKESLLRTLADDLGRDHRVPLAASLSIWVGLLDNPKRPVEQLLVRVIAISSKPWVLSRCRGIIAKLDILEMKKISNKKKKKERGQETDV